MLPFWIEPLGSSKSSFVMTFEKTNCHESDRLGGVFHNLNMVACISIALNAASSAVAQKLRIGKTARDRPSITHALD